MPGTMISRGNILYSYLFAPTLTPASVAVSTSAEQSFTVQGLTPGDQVGTINFASTQTAGIYIVQGRVPSANTLIMQFGNSGAAAAVPGSGIYTIEINRPEAGASQLPTSAG